ncbi:MAG: hypothetical protein JWO12_2908, partial [Frankiales bacterium]|nr:hypothetical protein [Frankiales bacterium]
EHGRYVVLVGWADPRKDVATAVAAHLTVVHEIPHRLVLVGGGRGVFAPVRTPAGSTISVLPHVTDRRLRALLTGAQVLLYPSLYEGFGLPPLEAAACGTPAIVSDLPVLRESTRGNATFVRSGDVRAWSDALRGALAAPTRVTATSPRSWGEAAAELAELLA